MGPTAVILAAGLGTRLRPLTYQVPKPLFPILNRPLLGLLLAQLAAAGFARVAINTHHQGEAIREFVAAHAPRHLEILVRHEPVILGTGGALKNLEDFLGPDPFVVINADIFTDIDLKTLLPAHQPEAWATLLLHDYPRFNTVWLDSTGAVRGFGTPPGPEVIPPLAFTGIHIVSPRLLALMPAGGFVNIIDTYRQAIAAGARIVGAVRSGFFWQDIGTPGDYLDLHRRLLRGEVPTMLPALGPLTDPYLGPGVVLGRGVQFGGGVCVGADVEVADGVCLRHTVIWSGAKISAGVRLENCIVGQNVLVTASAQGECLVA